MFRAAVDQTTKYLRVITHHFTMNLVAFTLEEVYYLLEAQKVILRSSGRALIVALHNLFVWLDIHDFLVFLTS